MQLCRSQPHIGLRHVTKQRPTIFGTLIEKPLGDHNSVIISSSLNSGAPGMLSLPDVTWENPACPQTHRRIQA
ncbi:putative ras-GEF domain-containing family member 1B-A [Triplophysa rosa]|uniref:Ras-GEF domain-containing family member 1B-A n=1 Tax=Triplophysa rosa TaxID=992332 RepID=A0A9W7X2X3_TRIRA|nr:putative ras-GEF domain-containing family member 1B-A [Triplophysa rosa]